MVKNMVFRCLPTDSSNDEEENDYVDEDEDEEVEDSRNEPPTKTPRQTPNNSRSRKLHSNKHDATPGRMTNANLNMTKDEVVKILAVNLNHFILGK